MRGRIKLNDQRQEAAQHQDCDGAQHPPWPLSFDLREPGRRGHDSPARRLIQVDGRGVCWRLVSAREYVRAVERTVAVFLVGVVLFFAALKIWLYLSIWLSDGGEKALAQLRADTPGMLTITAVAVVLAIAVLIAQRLLSPSMPSGPIAEAHDRPVGTARNS